ncbi:MAG: tetratricopeptide repeat protein [Butyricicoccaceae bacterium]
MSDLLTRMLAMYREGAEHGDAQAQYDLACLYETGMGVELDIGKALDWHLKAAEQCHTGAQFRAGRIYEILGGAGDGAHQAECYDSAVYWWNKSAEGGNRDAQEHLGALMESVAEDMEDGEQKRELIRAAADWYRKAAEQGSEDARLACERLTVE